MQIWTDIDGMHNNDPRFVDHTYPIRTMSFCEAAELAYFGAKILHPSTIQPCQDHGIPVLLKNTMDPDAPGTTISDADESTQSFHAVARQRRHYGNTHLLRPHVDGLRFPAQGVRGVRTVPHSDRHDLHLGSRRSLTIDNDAHIDRIVEELAPLGKIEIERDNSIVCVVGRIEPYRYRTRRTSVRRVKAGPDQNDLLRSEPPQHHDADQHAGQEANAAIPERLPFQPAIIHFRTILPPQNRV